MLSRTFYGLVLGLIMFMPRPQLPESRPPGSPPAGPDELPPTDADPETTPLPAPPGHLKRVPGGHHSPALPPTPPPGYDGEWPPASELPGRPGLPDRPRLPGRPDGPPTPPPGHDGPWPGERRGILDRIIDLLRELGDRDRGVPLRDTTDGARQLAGSADDGDAPSRA